MGSLKYKKGSLRIRKGSMSNTSCKLLFLTDYREVRA
jgi:chromosome segregation ATPase